ncbi:MAG: hypothetical protein JNM86_01905 [Phycisphaerae bacterium]|nr:hypothetical protein [Phycisphaerae bacterium]
MNSHNGSEVFRTGDRTRTPIGSSTGRVLLACAGLAMLAPIAFAGGRGGGNWNGGGGGGGNWNGGGGNWNRGGTSWGVSVGVSNGGSFVGGSYSSGFYGGRGWCPPPRPYCGPIVRPYCAPAFYGRPYWGPRPFAYCPPVIAPVTYLPPVVVAPNTYLVDRPAVSVGVGVAGSNGGGFFSYSSAPSVTVTDTVYAAAPAVQPVVYASAPSQVVTFVNPNPTTTVVQAPAPVQQAPQVAQPSAPAPATVFQSMGAGGTLDRSQSPASIVSVIRAETGDARATAAELFLGKTPAQAWPVTFEGVQETGGVKEVRCRPIDSLSNGYRPTIIVRGAGDSNMPPRQGRGFVTGRIVAISVDDPAYPGGLIVIDDGWLKW